MFESESRRELNRRAEAARTPDPQVHVQIQALAQGRFRPRNHDLRGKLQQELARIDQYHISRGLYNSSVRLSVRHSTHMQCLRSMLETVVQSFVEACETAGVFMNNTIVQHTADEIRRICQEKRTELLSDATKQTQKTGLGRHGEESLTHAVHRDVSSESRRAYDLLNTERVRQDLLANRQVATPSKPVAAPAPPVESMPSPPAAPEGRSIVAGMDAPAASQVAVVKLDDVTIRVSGNAAGIGPSTVFVRGEALAPLLMLVIEESAGSVGGAMIPWRHIESKWNEKRGYQGKPLTITTLQDYGRRIKRKLDEGGLGHLRVQDTGTGVRWRG